MIALFGCLFEDKIDSQMSIGPEYLRKILILASSQALIFLAELVCKNFLHAQQQSHEEGLCDFQAHGLEQDLNVQYSMVHITVIAVTRNTIVVECYDLKEIHGESDI